MGHPARTSCWWGESDWQTDGKVSHWEEVSQGKDFYCLAWLSLKIPEGCLVGSQLNVSRPARRQGGEEMERTSPQRADLPLFVKPGCKIDSLTQGETACWAGLTQWLLPSASSQHVVFASGWTRPTSGPSFARTGNPDKSNGKDSGVQRVRASSTSAEGCVGVSISFNSLTQGRDALQVLEDCGEGEQYPPVLIFLPFLKGAVTGLQARRMCQADGWGFGT